MPPLPSLLNKYIIRSDVKVNKSNLKTFCRLCIEELGEEEGSKKWFPNKKDRIIQHFKKCPYFLAKTNEEEQKSIFSLLEPNTNMDNTNLIPQKRNFSNSMSSQQSNSSHKVIIRSSYYGPMDNYIVRSLSKEDLQRFHMLLLRLSVSCGWALSWVNKPEAKELFDFLNPFLKLPDRRVLGGEILNRVVNEADKAMEVALKEDQVGITLTFDGWTNVKNEQLLGTVLLASEGRPYVWKAIDISSERENYKEVMSKTETMLTELKDKGITVCAIVTDSAAAYAAARRRMRISIREITFLPCFAHQINLCVGEIFKESVEFKACVDCAIKLAVYFKNSNHKFFIAQLRDQQRETYKKVIAISVPGETRWNSIYYMCTTLLKTQKALQLLAINFEPPIAETTCRKQGEPPVLPRKIFEIINSTTFWHQITLLTEILYPYCKILNVLQRDKARLFQVVHSINYLIQFWLNYSDVVLAAKLIFRLEKRWKEWEQPLLLLSYLLHPEYRMQKFNSSVSNINYSEFGKWLMYYYRAWSGKEPKCILREFDDFRLAKYPFDLDSYKQFNNDIWRYWCYISVSTNELGFVACRIFGICVNAASVERLWSCMGFLQTKRRNRLMSSKALKMSKLRADITYSHRIHDNQMSVDNNIDDNTNKIHDDGNDDEIDDDGADTNQDFNNRLNNLEGGKESNPAVDLEADSEPLDDDDDENTEFESKFGEYLQGWAEMLNEEDNDDDYDYDISLNDITHPAIDSNAKWELEFLFNKNINVDLPF